MTERDEAVAAKAAFYFTGRPCKNGHLSARRTSNWHCTDCDTRPRTSSFRWRSLMRRDPNAVPITLKDIYWVAGIIEGEGSFLLARRHSTCRGIGKTVYIYPSILLGMTDKDVVERVAGLLKSSVRKRGGRSRPVRKDIWITQILGARAASWMMTLLPIMGTRRADRIREILAIWRQKKAIGERFISASTPEGVMKSGSPDKKMRLAMKEQG